MKNFKSYKDIHYITNIDKSFTAIVGPNGSGKSNIIDSILFVLGFRAKKMRHIQITDLIYNDGVKANDCFVELAFNKFKIRREINANKITKYFYNEKEVSNVDLNRKMMDEGVDMEHHRFLILQGEIENIAMLKPKEGLLEFLEDIIGTSKYKLEIDSLAGKLKVMEEGNITCQNNLKFLKTEFDHISDLKKQNENILLDRIKYNEYLKELKNLNIEIITRNLHKKEEIIKKVDEEIKELKNLNVESKELLESLETEYNTTKKYLQEKEIVYMNIKREYKKLDRNNLIQKELKNKLEKQIKNLNNDLACIKAKTEMKNAESKILKKELKDNNLELKMLNNNRMKLSEKQKKEDVKIEKKCKVDLQNLKTYEDMLINLLNKKYEQNQKNMKSNMEIKFLKEQEILISEDINFLKTKIKNCGSIKHLNKNHLEKELKELDIDIQKTQYEIQKRKIRYNEVYQREEINKKEQELFSNFLGVKGVVGRLCDIGEVDSKYELPFKISCSRLNNIVVDSTQTAEKCIEIIKNKDLQRSTFIILDKIQEIPKLEKHDLPYMFDLVKCEKKYKKCFYFSLTDTLVADNLEKAKNCAFGKNRKRVVTLDAKLIEKSGIMIGGKYHEKVKRYEDIEKAFEKMTKLRDEKASNLQKIADFEDQKSIKSSLQEKENRFNNLKSDIKKLELSIKEYSYEEEINKVKTNISSCKAKIEKFYDSTLSVDLQIINEKIEILEGRNHEIKIILAEKIESCTTIEKELDIKSGQFADIEIHDLSNLKLKLDFEENSYNKISKDYKIIQENLNDLKKKMGSDYHIEVDLKNKLENLNEILIELKIKKDNEIQSRDIILDEINQDNKSLNSSFNILNTASFEDLSSLSDEDIEDFQKKIQKKLKKINDESDKKEVNLFIFEEYKKIKMDYEKNEKLYDIQISKYEVVKQKVDLLKKTRYEEFLDGLSKVNLYLKEIYKKLTYGGNAELELIDYLDPFSDGIRLAVMPPKKCWKNVSNLSGGERTLSSLSLIFALHKFKPSPFYIMDEIDAALDFRNVSIISQYIKDMARSSQFIVISLRNDMFEISNSVLGVYKMNNISRFLIINVDEIRKKLF